MSSNSLNKDQDEILADPTNTLVMEDYIPHTGKAWYTVPHFLNLYWAVFLIALTSTNNGYDGSMLNGLQSLTSWQTHMSWPKGAVLGALSNGAVFGVILSFPFAPYICDKFGRKAAIFIGQGICVIGSVLQGVSTNYAFFLVARIIIGFGSGIATVGSPTLISELAFPTHRHAATSFYNTCWYLGAVIAAWVTYGTRNLSGSHGWRVPSYLQGAVPLIQICLLWMVPESPRFHVSRGNIDKAKAILSKYHTGDAQDEVSLNFIKFELAEIERSIELEKLSSTTSYMDFLKIPAFRRRLFICFFVGVMMQLSGNGLVSYYLNRVLNSIGITSEDRQLIINGCLMIYNMVISMVIAACVGFFKRRLVFLTSLGLMTLFYVIWTILSALNQKSDFKHKSLGNGVLAMIFLYYLAYNLGLNGMPYLYITEILPYTHRSKGVNIFVIVQNIVIVYNGFVNPIAMDAIDWKYYIVFCCFVTFEFVVVFFVFPETSGYSLEEVGKVFGDDAASVHLQLPEMKATISHDDTADDKV